MYTNKYKQIFKMHEEDEEDDEALLNTAKKLQNASKYFVNNSSFDNSETRYLADDQAALVRLLVQEHISDIAMEFVQQIKREKQEALKEIRKAAENAKKEIKSGWLEQSQ